MSEPDFGVRAKRNDKTTIVKALLFKNRLVMQNILIFLVAIGGERKSVIA